MGSSRAAICCARDFALPMVRPVVLLCSLQKDFREFILSYCTLAAADLSLDLESLHKECWNKHEAAIILHTALLAA